MDEILTNLARFNTEPTLDVILSALGSTKRTSELDNLSSDILLNLTKGLGRLTKKINDGLNFTHFSSSKSLDNLFFSRILSSANQTIVNGLSTELNSGNASALTNLTSLITDEVEIKLQNISLSNLI